MGCCGEEEGMTNLNNMQVSFCMSGGHTYCAFLCASCDMNSCFWVSISRSILGLQPFDLGGQNKWHVSHMKAKDTHMHLPHLKIGYQMRHGVRP